MNAFVPDIKPLSGEGVMCRWVMISGHKDNMNNEITTKWEKTGLLEGLDELNKNECVASLETAFCLLSEDSNGCSKEIDEKYNEEGFFPGMLLPIIRRLYNRDEGIPEKMPTFNIQELMNEFYMFCLLNHQLYYDLNSTTACDGPAEFVQLFIDEFVKNYE